MTHSFDKEYWDQIWHGDRAVAMGSSETNPHLIQAVSDLVPGTAIDAGCGAGAEAIWLAQRGWQVTGADVAAAALAFAAERAAVTGVEEQVQWVQADLSTWQPDVHYDLVTTHYAHPAMPQLEFYDRIAAWVAPAGTLLIVGHLHHDGTENESHGHGHGHRDASGQNATGHGHGQGEGHADTEPPASASATAAAITARLDRAVWEIETAEESHRTMAGPGGSETSIHDVVVKATRRPGTQPPVP